MFYQDLKQDDLITSINKSDCLLLNYSSGHELASYIIGLANSENGGCIVIGLNQYDRTTFIKIEQNEINNQYQQIIKQSENIETEIHIVNGVRVCFALVFIDVKPSESLASFNGIVYTLIEGKPKLMPEKEILNRLGLGLNSDLLNNISFQIYNQSSKLELLQKDLELAKSWKIKFKDWLCGGLIGTLIGALLSLIAQIYLKYIGN